ncbi:MULTISPECIES: NAD(P)/FAD-dependent oxidoreductase [Nocardiopsis]|uniref:NADH dehydrogenase n=1 Tax=Nocardiopsis sinuspersici TaxID=501010 RepID=A0A1V3C2Y4_9ACTN|nr:MULTISPECIES: NAD(P)/FAD-dependent oxidoreductase [Nocardiopsis]NYH51016.1 NADH dehydrogenase [Nocardiopsis sinuspersici]OOC54819.1 NADH dehydrogenase [Nocardiopsis sinuspersici]
MSRPRIVVVGAGFGGLHTLRHLERRIPAGAADIALVAPHDYMLYSPLLPQVASGLLTPQSVAMSVHRLTKQTRLVPGHAIGVDTQDRVIVVRRPTGELAPIRYDRLVLAPGGVTRAFDIPGLSEHAYGAKTLAEAVLLRDHVLSQLELANDSRDPAEREERCRFVVVGGSYTGVETAASLMRLCEEAAKRYPDLRSVIRWHLVDIAPKVLPELGDRLGNKALDLLRSMGIEVKLKVSVREVTADKVVLTDGRALPCRTLIWTAGVSPSPLMETLDKPTQKGRLEVDPELRVPGLDDVFAIGDAAAVPNLSEESAYCPPTAQYATRQASTVAENVVSSILRRPMKEFRHKDMGLVVDLSGNDALARVMQTELSGLPALAVTRGYHMMSVPSATARARILANWGIRAFTGGDISRLGFADGGRPSSFVANEAVDYLDAQSTRREGARLMDNMRERYGED